VNSDKTTVKIFSEKNNTCKFGESLYIFASMKDVVKLENGYWVIGTNKWSKSIYTKEQAEKYSETLINCNNCINCRSCSSCIDCTSCSDFKTNPQRIFSPILGSRDSQTMYYWNSEHEQIICGCFKGTLSEFESKVKETHGTNEHAQAYLKWINEVKIYKNSI